MTQWYRLLIISFWIGGCVGPLVPVVPMSDLPADKQKAIQNMKVYESKELAALKYEVVGDVQGFSCKNKVWDPPATQADAISQAKIKAFDLGANGLGNVQCGPLEGTSLSRNCWESLACTGQGVRVKE